MGEIPAEWLEKSAANARAKMKPDPYSGSGGSGTKPEFKSEWIDFQKQPKDSWVDGDQFLALMKTPSGGSVLRGVRYVGSTKKFYYLNSVSIDAWSSGSDRIHYVAKVNFNLPKECKP